MVMDGRIGWIIPVATVNLMGGIRLRLTVLEQFELYTMDVTQSCVLQIETTIMANFGKNGAVLQ